MNTPTLNTAGLGLDMCLRSFAAALCIGNRWLRREFENNPAGFRRLVLWLKAHCVGPDVRIGVEATNTYADGVVQWLYEAGYAVFLLNPERLKHYAVCLGQRNKTDPADAVTIATYVARHECTPWQPPAPEQKTLREMTRCRRALVDTRTQLMNQLRTATGAARDPLQTVLATVNTQIKSLERQIAAHLAAFPQLGEQVRRVTTITGIGVVTAAAILAELPPITKDTDPRTICAWAGLTPRRHQSGPGEGRTTLSRKGNVFVREALYMPALVAKRWNTLFKDYHARLAAKGKSTRAILGAIAHKMLRIIVGVLKSGTDFDPAWSPQK